MKKRVPITDLCAECITALGRLHELAPDDIADPAGLYDGFRAMIDRLYRRAAQAGYHVNSAEDMAYPIIALADELAMSKGGALEHYWSSEPLQLRYFNENVGGENFFPRMQRLREYVGVDPEMLRVYYVCLLLGFGGELGLLENHGELDRKTSLLREDLERAKLIRLDEDLAPHGGRPRDEGLAGRRRPPLIWMAVSFAVFSMFALYLVLFVRHGAHLDAFEQQLRDSPRAATAGNKLASGTPLPRTRG